MTIQRSTRLIHALGIASVGSLLFGSMVQGCSERPADELRNCDVPAIFASSCNGNACHGAEFHQANLDLVSPGVDQRLFHVQSTADCGERKLVVPGHPEQSLLYNKISNSVPLCGDPMPLNRALSKSEIACVYDYIERAGTDVDVENCETCGTILCIDQMRDRQHCGGCNQACESGMVCADGQCIDPCAADQMLCGASCVRLSEDPQNCGSCGHRCGPGTSCNDGECRCDDGDVAGGGAGGVGSTGPVSFSEDILPLLDTSCSGSQCHTEEERVAPLDLEPTAAYDHLVNVMAEGCDAVLVVPGDPDNSYLLDKLLGGTVCDGAQMPLAEKQLPDAALSRFVRWICDGALNN